jgi:Uma2 family endonuclease
MAIAPSARRQTAPPEATRTASPGLFLRIPADAFTLDGFRAWVKSDELPEKLRVTFLRGEIYLEMPMEALQTHNKVKGEVTRVLMNLNVELELGDFYLDGVLVSNEEAEVSNNPDATFVSWKSLDAGKVRLVPHKGEEGDYTEIEGTPDWVMEVVSTSSVKKDTVELREAYHQAGIREYWLIDARGEEVAFQILHWRKKGYAAAPVKDGWQRSRVFGRGFRLERKKGRRGLWQYRLLVQPE